MIPPEKNVIERDRFYALAVKRYKAELKLYGATACIHLENKNDEIFWGKILKHAHPKARFRFIYGSRNPNGNMTYGCTQCLHYRLFLDRQFLIAIDSDYRYLTQEPYIVSHNYILQTYTYSFENHFCYAPNANRALQLACESAVPVTDLFDFEKFLTRYSQTVYPLLVWQLYLSSAVGDDAFPKHVFHRLLTLTVGARSIADHGAKLIETLSLRTQKLLTHFRRRYPDHDFTWFEARCSTLGVTRNNAYLFIRGHQLYDCLVMIGRKVVSEHRHRQHLASVTPRKGQKSFEQYLTSHLCFDAYDEIRHIEQDIHSIFEIQ